MLWNETWLTITAAGLVACHVFETLLKVKAILERAGLVFGTLLAVKTMIVAAGLVASQIVQTLLKVKAMLEGAELVFGTLLKVKAMLVVAS